MQYDEWLGSLPHTEPDNTWTSYNLKVIEENSSTGITYSLPKSIESSRTPEVININKVSFTENCDFAPLPMPSALAVAHRLKVKYSQENREDRDCDLSVDIEVIDIRKLDTINPPTLLALTWWHLCRTMGSLSMINWSHECRLLRDTEPSLGIGSVCYERSQEYKGYSTEGYGAHAEAEHGFYTPLNSRFILLAIIKLDDRIHKQLPAVVDYVKSLTQSMMKTVKIHSDAPTQNSPCQKIVEKDLPLTWEVADFRSRYEAEKRMLNEKRISPNECSYTFSQDDLYSEDIVMCGNSIKHSRMSSELVAPELDFNNFQGKISVPTLRYPNDKVDQEELKKMTEAAITIRTLANEMRTGKITALAGLSLPV